MPLFEPSPNRVRSPFFPSYTAVKHFMRILEGVDRSTVKQLIASIFEHAGTPQKQVDWSDPDGWIDQRLSGNLAALAKRIWSESGRFLNPRYLDGCSMFVWTYKLMIESENGRYVLTPNGKAFLADDVAVIRELDHYEGIAFVLDLLSTRDRAKRSDLLPDWTEFLKKYSRYRSPSTIVTTLFDRLWNLRDRKLVDMDGARYSLTEAGQKYLAVGAGKVEDAKLAVLNAIRTYNAEQKHKLNERLHKLSPKQFEDLVGLLLNAMEYQEVQVTQLSGDKGVDVVATAQFGITTVKEFIQVKRMKSNIGRPVLDQLRGALQLHRAIKGTLMTLSDFSTGCKEAAAFPGAVPITLINGEKLLGLLIDNGIGIKTDEVKLYELDLDSFGTQDDVAGETGR